MPTGCRLADRLSTFTETYFKGGSSKQKNHQTYAFRCLSEFMGFERDDWRLGLGRFFSLPEHRAEETLHRFTTWLLERRKLSRFGQEMCRGVLRQFSERLHQEGLIDWEIYTLRRLKVDEAWGRCPADLRSWVDSWAQLLRNRDLSPSTIRGRVCSLLMLGRYLSDRQLTIQGLEDRHLCDWVASLRSEGYAPRSLLQVFITTQAFYRWLQMSGRIRDIPFTQLPRIRVPRDPARYLTEDEMKQMLDLDLPPLDRAVLEVFYSTGCRVAEIRSLKLPDVSLSARTARCTGKGRKDRVVFLTRVAVRAIRNYLHDRQRSAKAPKREKAIFLKPSGIPLRSRDYVAILTRLGKEANIRSHVTPHVIRHSFATHLLNRGCDLQTLAKLLGHSRLSSTAIYARAVPDRILKVYRRTHPRQFWQA